MERLKLEKLRFDYVVIGPGNLFSEPINGNIYWLGQGCTNCDTWIAGEGNFHLCPNCGGTIAYAETPEVSG